MPPSERRPFFQADPNYCEHEKKQAVVSPEQGGTVFVVCLDCGHYTLAVEVSR